MHTLTLFISAVSDEFGQCRRYLRENLQLRHFKIYYQEDFCTSGHNTLDTIDDYILASEAVIHLVGKRTGKEDGGSIPPKTVIDEFLERRCYHKFQSKTNLTAEQMDTLSYTQWEAWLALYHGKQLFLISADPDFCPDHAVSDPAVAAAQEQAQQLHLTRLKGIKRYAHPRQFRNEVELENSVLNFLINSVKGVATTAPPQQTVREFPTLNALIVCSRSQEETGRQIRDSLNAFRLPGESGRKVFDATPYESAYPIEDFCAILFLLEDADPHSGGILARARAAQKPGRNRHPRIIFVTTGLCDISGEGCHIPGPAEEGHEWIKAYETFDSTDPNALGHRLYDEFTPRFEVIWDGVTLRQHERSFDQAMEIYAQLIPIDEERDTPENIADWICDSNGDRDDWLDYLTVATYPDGEVFGAFWCNIDLRTGLGHVPFWGMMEGYRSGAIGVHLAGFALVTGKQRLAELTGGKVAFQGVVFEAETVDTEVFQRCVDRAYGRLMAFENPGAAKPKPGGWLASLGGAKRATPAFVEPLLMTLSQVEQGAVLKRLTERQGRDANTILETTLLEMTADPLVLDSLVEQVRRFRRLYLYGGKKNIVGGIIKSYGFKALGFVTESGGSAKDQRMAVYRQPPIVANPYDPDLPVRDDDACDFALYVIVDAERETDIDAQTIIDWEYDVFLGEQFRDDVSGSGLTGWIDFMIGFKERHRQSFIDTAKLRRVELGKSYDIAMAILRTLNDWIAKKHPGWELIKQRIPPKF